MNDLTNEELKAMEAAELEYQDWIDGQTQASEIAGERRAALFFGFPGER